LNNPYLTEAWITKAILRADASPVFIAAVCRHSKWSLRRDIRIALVRSEHTPEPYASEFLHSLPATVVRDILDHARLSARIRAFLLEELERRERAKQS